ncbi:HNH endonuclease [Candidatus Pacearchaeota archaeon]|nr:HNH endonuclease [Candidatus Pacearchaeota archaeon]
MTFKKCEYCGKNINAKSKDEIKKAFSPKNLQWLTREDNRRKSGKILIDNNFVNKNLGEGLVR